MDHTPARRPLPPQNYLRECFTYSPETGELHWRVRPLNHFLDEHRQKVWNTRYANKPAGHKVLRKDGYLVSVVHVNWDLHIKARIIYKLMHNQDPHSVDHIDGNPQNDCLDNLRAVNDQQNALNRRIRSDNTTGYKGVALRKGKLIRPYQAYINAKGTRFHLGFFATAEEAATAYKQAENHLFEEYARKT